MRLKDGIEALMAKQDLNSEVCQQIVTDLLHPDTNPLQKSAFLVLLRSKTETAEELVGMASALQEKMTKLRLKQKVLDIVGTGGDSRHTVNISTGSAILAAASGVVIAKHGNAAVTSLSGSADVLKALGVAIDISPEKIISGIETLGIGFCFAPNFHPILRELRSFRQQLNVPTSFNILGPLLNPAQPAHLLLGVFDPALLPIIGLALQKMGTVHSMVVHGYGIDELSCLGPVQVVDVTAHAMEESYLDPQALGFSRCSLQDLQGGSAAVNAALLRDALQDRQSQQAKAIADTILFNAAVAVYLYGLQPSVAAAIPLVREQLLSGAALTLLNQWIDFSNDESFSAYY